MVTGSCDCMCEHAHCNLGSTGTVDYMIMGWHAQDIMSTCAGMDLISFKDFREVRKVM